MNIVKRAMKYMQLKEPKKLWLSQWKHNRSYERYRKELKSAEE